ncbi:AraC family transcriptional regulator [Novispirillum itersonii]|uniref:AraC-like DNA-binding protein n=1 Tax=Novispirillum itersonii TaxID=189 RepID=A0A7X0DKE4_NOVIT|nr:AraC family transcriptional regulator [Novispirillum itersonii]MBB6208876.1 AraC-like DNA-binding protein [Novispirillum itersonii]
MHLDIYRLDKDNSVELYPHSHITGQVFVIERGLVRTTALGADDPDGETVMSPGNWCLMPGQIGWMPPRVVHSAVVHGPVRGFGLHLPPELCGPLPRTARIVAQTALTAALLDRMSGWVPGPVIDPARQRLLQVLLDELPNAPALPNGLPLPQDPRLLRFAQALLETPDDKTPLADWAARLAMTERTLARRFTAETGQTCGQWRQQARLFRALELLADGEPVLTVALSVGYDSLSAFGAAFRRQFGQSPARFRTSGGLGPTA